MVEKDLTGLLLTDGAWSFLRGVPSGCLDMRAQEHALKTRPFGRNRQSKGRGGARRAQDPHAEDPTLAAAACSWAGRPLIDLLAYVGDALRSRDQSSITRLPASMILMRPTKRRSGLVVSSCAIASPARTRPASVPRVKPWQGRTGDPGRDRRAPSPDAGRRVRGVTLVHEAC
jgi:hypothetical protein